MYTAIVVGTDGSSTARDAVEQAASLARLCGARLHLVSAYRRISDALAAAPEAAMIAGGLSDADVEAGVKDMLTRVSSELRDVDTSTYAIAGNAAQAILDVAHNEKADLIVLGNRGMKGARRVLGSVPNNVAHHAECAVMIVPTC